MHPFFRLINHIWVLTVFVGWLKKLRSHRRPAPHGDMLMGRLLNPTQRSHTSLHDCHGSSLLPLPLAWHLVVMEALGKLLICMLFY
ncbi:hypothetical protein BDV28DRAFT_564 [Aspergillus coremiiformis]|uniref:Secreted protein n=1 Tax=Aspergillus coremiiformis TaxID=138285 RepID=A0A5N6ZGZ4_9EURO|nr:hypothetical protein BDV28DRAFT_564 [Aspergillus coremiiformis]